MAICAMAQMVKIRFDAKLWLPNNLKSVPASKGVVGMRWAVGPDPTKYASAKPAPRAIAKATFCASPAYASPGRMKDHAALSAIAINSNIKGVQREHIVASMRDVAFNVYSS